MGHDDAAASSLPHRPNEGLDQFSSGLVETGCGLIEKEQLRSGEEQMGDLHPALHPERARLGAAIRCLIETHDVEGSPNTSEVDPGEAGDMTQVLEESELGDEGGLVPDHSDGAACRHQVVSLPGVLAQHLETAPIDRDQGRCSTDQCRFPGSVGPGDTYCFTRLDDEIEIP